MVRPQRWEGRPRRAPTQCEPRPGGARGLPTLLTFAVPGHRPKPLTARRGLGGGAGLRDYSVSVG